MRVGGAHTRICGARITLKLNSLQSEYLFSPFAHLLHVEFVTVIFGAFNPLHTLFIIFTAMFAYTSIFINFLTLAVIFWARNTVQMPVDHLTHQYSGYMADCRWLCSTIYIPRCSRTRVTNIQQ